MKILLHIIGWFLVLHPILIAFLLEFNGFKIEGLEVVSLFSEFLIGMYFLIITKNEIY